MNLQRDSRLRTEEAQSERALDRSDWERTNDREARSVAPNLRRLTEGLRRYDVVAIVLAFSLVAFNVPLGPGNWASRIAVLLAVAPFGLAALVAQAIERDRLSQATLLLLTAVGVSSAASGAPLLALLGTANRHSSFLLLMLGASALQFGRLTTTVGRRWLGWSVVAGAAVSGFAALVELSIDYVDYLGRPPGLAVHPVYFGAFTAAAGGWFAYRISMSRGWGDAVGLITTAGLAGLSGSRIAVGAVVLLAAAASVRSRSALVAATAVGSAMVGWLAMGALRVPGVSAEQAEVELAAGDRALESGLGDRWDLWDAAVRAWLDRPLLGHGSGRFSVATQSTISDAWMVRYGSVWEDAHNIALEWLVAYGVVGVMLGIVVAILLLRRARGPLSWMASAIAVGWMLQPATAATLALAALLMGAAFAETTPAARMALPGWLRWSAAVIGLLLGSWYVAGDVAYDVHTNAERQARPALTWWYSFDPKLSDRVAVWSAQRNAGGDMEAALAWSQRATEQEPDLAGWHAMHALRHLQADDPTSAIEATDAAVELQPNFVYAWDLRRLAARQLGDRVIEAEARAAMCDIGACPP